MKWKFTPKQNLWTLFLMQVFFSLSLLFVAINVHSKTLQVLAQQPAAQASEARFLARIQTESDIEQLRTAAIHVQNASDITWNGYLKTMKWLKVGMWSLFSSSATLAFMGGYTVYAFRVRKPPTGTALKPTDTAL